MVRCKDVNVELVCLMFFVLFFFVYVVGLCFILLGAVLFCVSEGRNTNNISLDRYESSCLALSPSLSSECVVCVTPSGRHGSGSGAPRHRD